MPSEGQNKVFVTGANGFLAGYIIDELSQQGYKVKALVRRANAVSHKHCQDVEFVIGNMSNFAQMKALLFDCDYVVHSAACTDMSLLRKKDYHSANVETTHCLLDASVAVGIKRFVFIGTANSFALGTAQCAGDERQGIQKPFLSSGYALSKTEAMNKVLSYAGKMHVCVIAPSFMLGEGANPRGSGRIIKRAKNSTFIFHPPGGKNFVHVADVAMAVAASLQKGQNASAYLLVNENLSYKKFYQLVREATGQKSLLIEIPESLLITIGLFGDLFRFFGIKTIISSSNMRILYSQAFYSNKKAKDELSMTFLDTQKSVNDYLKNTVHQFPEK